MTVFKSIVQIAIMAALIFALNGLVNYSLMQPLAGGPYAIDNLRYHLDDAVFVLLFLFAGLLFSGMYAVLPKEKGYLYLSLFSLLSSVHLFVEWDEKSLLFGPFPNSSYIPLGVKIASVTVAFSFFHYLLGMTRAKISRWLILSNVILLAIVVTVAFFGDEESWLPILNRIFPVQVLAGMSLNATRLLSLQRRQRHREELRWIAKVFTLFILIILPDIGKDLLESFADYEMGYHMNFWEQSLEDTFPWALLGLVTVFGYLFFRRFVHTLRHNSSYMEQLKTKNTALEREGETRQRLDQLLTELSRAYRADVLEQRIILEGRRFFAPFSFHLIKYDESDGTFRSAGDSLPSSVEAGILSVIGQNKDRSAPGEAIVTPSIILSAAGGTGETRLYLALSSEDRKLIELREREFFALRFMSKYTSIFYEYFQLMESRLSEMEQRHARQQPWLTKLFMQIAEKERKRLASDLHDEVLQELLNIRRVLERSTEDVPDETDRESLRRGIDNAEFMIRETCHELMPSFLSEHGVIHAIAKLIEKTRLRADFGLNFRCSPIPVPLNDELALTVYRIVQELINNACKHLEASRVELEIGQSGSSLQITYADDGKGMEVGLDSPQSNRYGLRGIAERVRMSGGRITLESLPGQGVKVFCAIPLYASESSTNPA